MNIFNHKKIILIIIVVLLTFFGYWFIFLSKKGDTKNTNNSSNQNLKTQTNNSNNSNNSSNSDNSYNKSFVSSLIGLNSVKLDASIFELKEYQALSYPETPFVINYSKEYGRDNPFLPIGVNSDSSNSEDLSEDGEGVPSAQIIPTNLATSTTGKPPIIKPTVNSTSTSNSNLNPTSVPIPNPKRF